MFLATALTGVAARASERRKVAHHLAARRVTFLSRHLQTAPGALTPTRLPASLARCLRLQLNLAVIGEDARMTLPPSSSPPKRAPVTPMRTLLHPFLRLAYA
ncbi:hypothetical protein E2C01_065910 [Portunus trituberculatus]|uniref:Uncharacterized protein n=1 Tax=Portunus trituberculatus TaxID=210409 RepID=A0A5B7HNV6_PORTR|nr:hypothetical protein [Portunus trituberculatus]